MRLGGIVGRTPHPAAPELALAGGPQMVEISRDGRRVYFTNSLYAAWDEVFYPDGVGAWMARIDADTDAGGMTVDPRFFPHGDDFRGLRVHQTRLQGGDASSDSYCFTSSSPDHGRSPAVSTSGPMRAWPGRVGQGGSRRQHVVTSPARRQMPGSRARRGRRP